MDGEIFRWCMSYSCDGKDDSIFWCCLFILFHSISLKQAVPFVAKTSGGSKGTTPRTPNSFNYMQFLRKFGKIVCWRPPGELAPPPRGNAGSATGCVRMDQKMIVQNENY